MIFPRTTALEAASSIRESLTPLVGKIADSGDLRMEKSTLSRIEFVVEQCDRDQLVDVMSHAGWRKLRTGRGPLVFACAGFPKAVICTAHKERADLLGVNRPSNFEVLLFLRTGTQIFLRGILDHIRDTGFSLKPEQGLCRGDKLIAWTEEPIFRACGLSFIPPNERYHFRPEKYRTRPPSPADSFSVSVGRDLQLRTPGSAPENLALEVVF